MDEWLSFGEFEPFSAADWRTLAEKDLKGKPFEQYLRWKSTEGFEQQAWQDQGNNPRTQHPEVPWHILEPVESGSTQVLTALNAGAEGLYFLHAPTDWEKALEDVVLDIVPLYARINTLPKGHLQQLVKLVSAPAQLQGALLYDPIGDYLINGTWPEGMNEKLTGFSECAQNQAPHLKTAGIVGSAYHHAGAGMVDEVAFIFLHALEYVNALVDQGIETGQAVNSIAFELAFDHHFLGGIAKVRALRKLWESFWETSGIETEAHIIGTTAQNNKSSGDEHSNILRMTTEAMAAVLGGCHAVAVMPWDRHFRDENAFSSRISRNVQLLLKEESRLDKNLNPVDGSYYLDSLTENIAREAWDKVRHIKSKGTYMDYILSGSLKKDVVADRQKKKDQLAKETMIGVNKFRKQGQGKEQDRAQPAKEAILSFWNKASEAEKSIAQ